MAKEKTVQNFVQETNRAPHERVTFQDLLNLEAHGVIGAIARAASDANSSSSSSSAAETPAPTKKKRK